ncbi:MAG: MerR family transcriptional regulator [Pseudomonadota bacterium]
MGKAPTKAEGAFRTIREVSDWLGVPTHVLRFWESKFEQIAPVKGAGGRRYYRPEDMKLLGGIKVMLHDQGQTIRAVAQSIDDDGTEQVMAQSPALDMPESAPPRTRKVIRDTPAEEEAKAPSAEAEPDPTPEPADEPADATDETLTEASVAEPAPDPAPAPDASSDPEPAKPKADPAPSDPAPSEGGEVVPFQRALPRQPVDAGADPAIPQDSRSVAEAPADPGDLLPEQPDDGTALPAAADPVPPAETRTDAPAPPADEPAPEPVAARHAEEVPPAEAPVETDAPAAAIRSILEGATIAPSDRVKLRRLYRRLRALADEVRDDLTHGTLR